MPALALDVIPFSSHNHEPRTFAQWLDHEARAQDATGDARGRWLAGKIRELAETARWLQADTPADFDARSSVMEED